MIETGLVRREKVLKLLKQLREEIWLVDIPLATVPEYIEHHRDIVHLLNVCDDIIRKISTLEVSNNGN